MRPFALLRLGAVLALALAVLLSTSAVVADEQLVKVSDPDPYFNCSVAGQPGMNFPDTEVEPYVAVNPATIDGGRARARRTRSAAQVAPRRGVRVHHLSTDPLKNVNLVGVWQQDRWSNGGARGLAAGFSFDGGQHWGLTPLAFSRCAQGGLPYERASDAWVSIGPDGTVYAISLSFDATTDRDAIATATSNDGGRTWSNVQVINAGNSPERAQDKESVTADPTQAGVAYAVWDEIRLSNCNPPGSGRNCANVTVPTLFSKTTDGGRTWSPARVIVDTADREQTIGNQIIVDPDTGNLYNFFDLIEIHLRPKPNLYLAAFVKSTDGGQTWTSARVISQIETVGVRQPGADLAPASAPVAALAGLGALEPLVHSRPLHNDTGPVGIRAAGDLVRTGDILPEATIDSDSGRLFVVWQDARFNGGKFDEVLLSSSDNEGITWSAPVRVNTPTERPAFTPSVQVTADGTVAVTYYDFRNHNPTTPNILLTDYWITFSDDGVNFDDELHVAGPFNMRAAPNARGFFVGDYEGLTTIGNSFVPFFSQTNCADNSCDANRGGPNPTDIFAGRFEP